MKKNLSYVSESKGPRRIVIKDGVVCGFYDEVSFEGLALVKFEKERVSRIVPESAALRVVFYLARFAFGETGKVSDWTRGWVCRWLLIVDGDVVETFLNRNEAIRFEKDFIFKQGKISLGESDV